MAPAAAAEFVDVRFGVHDADTTRVVFDLSGPVEYSISGDERGAGRLIVDFKGVSAAKSEGRGAGHVARYSISSGTDGLQAILDLGRTAKIKEQFVLPPKSSGEQSRLVIDLVTSNKAGLMASLPQRYADLTSVLEEVTAAEMPSTPPELPIVVIDPGHGGGDPGAQGPTGVLEKSVTLAAAKKLGELLEAKKRYQVVLTRDGDARLGLEERSKIARDAGADLFISLHADAHSKPSLRGGSVYTLSESGSERSARDARAQGDYHVFDLNIKDHTPEVGGILFDLAQRKTTNESAYFAEILVSNLSGVTPLVNNTHRTGDLFVLLSPDVPAVLFELAFISNKSDEANLNSAAWREKTMTAVAAAIDDYFDAREPVRHASRSTKGAQ